ncbi:CoA-disulfide reductase [Paenisporosarcina cavernae]|uniref:CoA-disulfide reductase n=1 Tax=Paenisporosarcina cavernae TaxID=2320858 RepID=A0A385YTJ6_9BACL|nr:CoA-disulfide reductase [Paenisporosarcina cavernae]AYC28998.1 CoA-disulfide reductase [Paenisporosarcina cavernae]
MKKIVIVGAVAGGATAASQIRRLDETAEIIVFDKQDVMSYAACGMPYYLGGTVKKRSHLIATTPEKFKTEKSIDVRLQHEVLSIHRDQKIVRVIDGITGNETEESYDVLILSTGGIAKIPKLKGLDRIPHFTLRTLDEMDAIDSFITENQPKNAVLLGGGFTGMEMAENLTERGVQVTMIERNDRMFHILDPEASNLVEKELTKNGVQFYLEEEIAHIDEKSITLTSGKKLNADFLLINIGITANNSLAKEAGIHIGPTGGIQTNGFLQTNDPDIYAVGDVIENIDFITHLPKQLALAWPAHRQAYIVAKHLCGEAIPFKGFLGTAISKLFDITIAMTGLSKENAEQANIPFKTIKQTSKSNAGYYPHGDLLLVVHYHEKTHKIIGAQVIGEKGADKRIDVLSTAIYAGLTVDDLEELELAYSPPYSSPKDPVNMIGYKA